MNKFKIDNILAISQLKSELEVEKASSMVAKFNWMQEEDESLKPLRKHLVFLIEKYENEHWADIDDITDKQMEESEKAEWFTEQHNLFIQRRKEVIRNSLKERGLIQKDLARILDRSVSYLSEQMNGLRQFSYTDIKILSRSFKIPLNDLFDLYMEENVRERVKAVIKEYPQAKLELNKEDLILA